MYEPLVAFSLPVCEFHLSVLTQIVKMSSELSMFSMGTMMWIQEVFDGSMYELCTGNFLQTNTSD